MNIYKQLNEIIDYIENNLDDEISYKKISQMMGVNEYTMQRLFSILTNISLSEYIRNRRLSIAGYDLYYNKLKVIDVAMKYGYDNSISFSRAFEKFHGIKPSKVKNNMIKLKNYPKLIFNEQEIIKNNMEYEIIELEELHLYGKGIKTSEDKVSNDAPMFWKKMNDKYSKKYGKIDYGMVAYIDRFNNPNFEYWILWNKKIEEFKEYIIPKSKWLVFHVKNNEAIDIQKLIKNFYLDFVPSTKYQFREIPELEYYHDDVCDFLVPIE